MKSEGGRIQEFDRFLDDELTGRLGRLNGPSPHPEQAVFRRGRGGRVRSILASVPAGISSRATVALTAAFLIVGAGSVAAAAATGSPNPSVWGRTVSSAAQTCRADLSSGDHGIGPCVSAIARRHRQDQPATNTVPAATPTPEVTPLPTAAPTATATAPAVTAPTPTPQPKGRPTTLPTPAMNAPGHAKRATGKPAGRPSPAPQHNQ